jgi:ketosteroid isomerase-like protein
VADAGNAEIARGALAAWSRGDLEATLATVDPDIEWHVSFALPDLPPDKAVFRGHEELADLWRAFRSAWEELTLEIERVVRDEDDTLVLEASFHGRGGGSGIEVERRIFYVMQIRDGLLLRMRPFASEAEALAAADRG